MAISNRLAKGSRSEATAHISDSLCMCGCVCVCAYGLFIFMFGCVVYPYCHSWNGKALKTVEWGTGFRYYDGIYDGRKWACLCVWLCMVGVHIYIPQNLMFWYRKLSPTRRRLVNIVLRSFGADSENIKTNSVECFSSSPKRHVSVTLCIYTLHMNEWHKSSDKRTSETTDARGWQMAHGQIHRLRVLYCGCLCTYWGDMWILCVRTVSTYTCCMCDRDEWIRFAAQAGWKVFTSSRNCSFAHLFICARIT